ncbi:MAG: HU family DNA-binding protein [Chloroflexota bacterium]|nr:MAG: HU family DNA-binding protein [Chloroflexota bacterium]
MGRRKIIGLPGVVKRVGAFVLENRQENKQHRYKTDIVRQVAKDTGLTQREVLESLNGTLKQISSALSRGEVVVFPGFGSFYTRVRAASSARSFATGKRVEVPAMHMAGFRAGKLLKERVRARKTK